MVNLIAMTNTIPNAGANTAQGLQNAQRLQELMANGQQMRRNSELRQLQQMAMSGDQGAVEKLSVLDPNYRTQQIQQGLLQQKYQMGQQEMSQQAQQAEQMRSLQRLAAVPPEMKTQVMNEEAARLQQQGHQIPAFFMGEYTPQIEQLVNKAVGIESPSPMSRVGKIQQDVSSGYISPEQAQAELARESGTTVNLNQGGSGLEELYKKRASARSDSISKAYEESNAAINTLPAIQKIEQAVAEDVTTGGIFSSGKMLFGQTLAGLGMEVPESISTLEGLQESSREMAIPLAKQLGVNPTDKDFENILATIANIGKSQEANARFAMLARRAMQRKIEIADMTREAETQAYETNSMKPLIELEKKIAQYNQKNPLNLPTRKELSEYTAKLQSKQGSASDGGQMQSVTTQAEFDALPSGAIYLEDGVEYRKP